MTLNLRLKLCTAGAVCLPSRKRIFDECLALLEVGVVTAIFRAVAVTAAALRDARGGDDNVEGSLVGRKGV